MNTSVRAEVDRCIFHLFIGIFRQADATFEFGQSIMYAVRIFCDYLIFLYIANIAILISNFQCMREHWLLDYTGKIFGAIQQTLSSQVHISP